MTGVDLLKFSLELSLHILTGALKDIKDEELVERPGTGSNNLGWQLGHLITSEKHMLGGFPGFHYPELPAGFDEKHANKPEIHVLNTPTGYKVSDYLAHMTAMRTATLAALAKLTEKDLDLPSSGPLKEMAPTLGTVLELASQHFMMHSGHISVLRRKLAKPVLF